MNSKTSPFNQNLARIAVGGYDDMQDVRTAMYNRIRDVVRKRNEDIPFDEVEEEKEEQDYESEYDDDNLPELIEQMRAEDKLSEEEFSYLRRMLEAGTTAQSLENQFKGFMEIVEAEPIYTEWLQHVYGVSHTLTARLIHQFGYCEESERVTQMWAYAGLAPGQKRRQGEKLGYNPQAKTLAWLVADRIIMQGDKSRYRREFFDPYKKEQVRRLHNSVCHFCGEASVDHESPKGESVHYCPDTENEVTGKDFDIPGAPDNATPPWSQGHAHNRAVRYLAKKFLKHYWAICRDIKDLPIADEYVLVYGDDEGQDHEKRTDTFENPLFAKRDLAHASASAD